MNNLDAYLIFSLVFMGTRLKFLGPTPKVSVRTESILVAVQILALLGTLRGSIVYHGVLIAALVGYSLFIRFYQRIPRALGLLDGIRFLVLVLVLVHAGITYHLVRRELADPPLFSYIRTFYDALELNLRTPLIIINVALILFNEVNLLIRWVLYYLDLEPKKTSRVLASSTEKQPSEEEKVAELTDAIDLKQYRVGRVIGMLERYLIFVVVISSNNYAAVAVLVGAKGLTRLKRMDDPAYSEYVLVGTLLSTLSTIGVALLVKAVSTELESLCRAVSY